LIRKSIDIWNSLYKSELLKNTTVLVSGTVVAQLIPILLQPVLRRFYTPEDFGAFAVYLSLIGIFVVITSFKYELAIVLPEEDQDAANLIFLSFLLNLGLNILLFVIILIWHKSILEFINLSPEYSVYLYFVPFGTFLYGFYQSINYWLIRKKGFFEISLNKFVRRGFEGGVQIGAIFCRNAKGLLYGDLIGQFSNVIFGANQCLKRGFSFNMLNWQKLKNISVKYSEFPKFNLVPGFMSASSFLLPVLLVNKYFGSEYTGFLDLSKLLLSIPLALVATSLSNVLLQRISEKFRSNQSITKELQTVFLIVASIALAEIVVISLFGINLFKFIFGNEWEYSGIISKVLVWSYAFNFIAAAFSFIYIALKRIKLLSLWQMVYFVSILSMVMFRNYPFNQFIMMYTIIEVICSVLSCILMVYIVIKHEEKIVLMNKH
jgi:O-antigen/teichoic acid export membrane protein